MLENTEKSKVERAKNQQEKLDPCVTPQSPEAERPDKAEEACDDGVK